MKITIFHLNIQGGRKLDEIIAYLKEQDFDIIHLQEISAGSISKSGSDNFKVIKNSLGLQGELVITTQKSNDPSTYHGIATFYRPTFSCLQKEVIWLKSFEEFDTWIDGGDFARNLPKAALALQFSLNGKNIWSINTHLAWGPTPYDEPYKVQQASILIDYIKQLEDQYILTGDFNVTKDSKIVKDLNQLAINHTVRNELTNTLNSHLHRAKELFPEGLAVDYIYSSFRLSTEKFALVDSPDLSDHYGLKITIEI